MKRILVGISLLFCLIAPLVSTFVFLHFQKSQVRKEIKHQMMRGIDQAELVLLKFTKEESRNKLKWKHSKEFEYAGQMYDIVNTAYKGDTIYFWTWCDHEETKLNQQLDQLIANVFGNTPKKKDDSQSKLIDFYKHLYCNSYCIPTDLCPAINFTEAMFVNHLRGIYFSPSVPPPQVSYI